MVVEYHCSYFFLNEDLVGLRPMINLTMMSNCRNPNLRKSDKISHFWLSFVRTASVKLFKNSINLFNIEKYVMNWSTT